MEVNPKEISGVGTEWNALKKQKIKAERIKKRSTKAELSKISEVEIDEEEFMNDEDGT
jgi:hypothetical protein